MKRTLVLLVLVLLLVGAGGVRAHHSFAAEFDASKAVRLNGTLMKVEWTNPHIYFYIDVKDDAGNIVRWTCESGAHHRGRIPRQERRDHGRRASRDAA